ncbi:MAG: UDP-N-acetylmuramoyl-tripeptide--D-alanyl-D-alanine ligase [Arsenophonus endosymbiont of Dermacentor nuttalli]
MIPITVKQLVTLTQGALHQINDQQADSLWLNEVTTNSRQRPINGLFIALKGEHFDGHDFVADATTAGAAALLVDRPLTVPCPQVIVADTRLAMGKLAAWVRVQSKAKVIGLTGSSGKTSVKDMVAAILSQCGETLFTAGNFNNDIGVALTLFRLAAEHQYVVIEMGANHIGEIEYITNIVKPDSVLVNNLFAAHLEGFGSLAGVAKAKGEIFQGLAKKGTAVINLASHDWQNWQSYFKQQQTIWRFSIMKQQQADFYAENISIKSIGTDFELHTPSGVIPILLPLPGKHNVANALAASALAMSVGATLEQISLGLANVQPVSGRLYPINLAPGKLILDDTYNANTGSMIAAAYVLSQMPGYRILVVGDMGELGDKTEICHQEVGDAARKMKLDRILSVGQQSVIISQHSGCGEHFASKKELITKLITLIKEHDTVSVLVKGSRSTAMEEVVHAIKECFLC